MVEGSSALILERVQIPMAFIGGPLNLERIPAELLKLREFEAFIPGTYERTLYIKVVFLLPNRPNDDFIFYVERSSVSLDQATEIIKANFFK